MAIKAKRVSWFKKDYSKIVSIYKSSFPEAEQYPLFILRLLSIKRNVYSLAFYDKKVLVGFCYLFVNEKNVFILFLAMNPEIRSKGYGSQVLDYIKKRFGKRDIFLDVEAPDENSGNQEQRLKRIAFYQRNGICETGDYFEYEGVRFEVMSSNPHFTVNDYKDNINDFFKIVKNKKTKNAN